MIDDRPAESRLDVDSGGTFLVGFRGRLFQVQSDYQVAENRKPYSAVGSGTHLALGAMSALEPYDVSPRDKLRAALTAAATYCASVAGPFHYLKA